MQTLVLFGLIWGDSLLSIIRFRHSITPIYSGAV